MQKNIYNILAVVLSLFILAEVNYPFLTPQSQLAIFALLGLVLLFMQVPLHDKLKDNRAIAYLDGFLIALTVATFGFIFVQSEPLFQAFWIDGQPLGNRAGAESGIDYLVGFLGLVLVLESTRRSLGWILPALALLFIAYAAFGPSMPGWLFPHRGYDWQRIVSQTFLHSQGVFGIALKVMFTYVFLFVLFGTLLEQTGATGYIIDFARRIFRGSAGGPAKVAVISSGLMGSLSGSAVANTATTGTFTIPLMRSSGFKPSIAGGVEAAASSGGALVPPIMGAGAYMMLEIIDPPVTFLEIIKAAIIPAVLYYTALLFIVHFYARRIGAGSGEAPGEAAPDLPPFRGLVFAGAFIVLIVLLVMGYTPFRAVSVSLVFILILSAFHASTRVKGSGVVTAMAKAARSGVSLVAAASCVGIIIGVVTLTGIGARLPSVILPLAENNLVLALGLLMISTIILGMGLPSAVCYLLMATLIGPIFSEMGLVPLSLHLFIFYFGMMSMVTPPVALAAYTAGAIADAGIMETGFAAFRFALVGFTLPFAFVLQPELLLLSADGSPAGFFAALWAIGSTLFAIIPFAAGIAGHAFKPMRFVNRIAIVLASLIVVLSRFEGWQAWVMGAAALVIVGVLASNYFLPEKEAVSGKG